MVDAELVQRCVTASRSVRKHILDMTFNAGSTGAHLGGSLSAVELLTTLYLGILKYKVDAPDWEGRDRVVLSKGHSALALYAVMAEAGWIDPEELLTFKKDGSRLTGHPSLNGLNGIEYASGSLGMGLSMGVGACLGLRRKDNSRSRVFVIMGDGECDEGSIWEAAASAAHYRLNQLVGVVDANHIQYDGHTQTVMDMNPLADKWRDFGWDVAVVNGHDVAELLEAYMYKGDRPYIIIADTVKGKGVSFMENNYRYHNARLSRALYEQALAEVGASF